MNKNPANNHPIPLLPKFGCLKRRFRISFTYTIRSRTSWKLPSHFKLGMVGGYGLGFWLVSSLMPHNVEAKICFIAVYAFEVLLTGSMLLYFLLLNFLFQKILSRDFLYLPPNYYQFLLWDHSTFYG
jgi:hypothetical protein